jgi:prepilin-type N-terminal cleavage/methylation domain-containing protein
MRRKAFTLIELLVVVAIIALLISILLPSLARARELSKRAVCSANLKGIGTAIATYANDNDQAYPIPPADMNATTGGASITAYTAASGLIGKVVARNVQTTSTSQAVSMGRGLWMLVRDGATAPKQFICPSSDQSAADDTDPMIFFDFPDGKNLSYGMQVPYGAVGKPNTDRDPRMPLAADRGWYGAQVETAASPAKTDITTLNATSVPDDWKPYNSPNHGGFGDGEGQNIMFSDFHVEFLKRPIEGIGLDNIYTRWSQGTSVTQDMMVRGIIVSGTQYKNAPWSDTDTVIFP